MKKFRFVGDPSEYKKILVEVGRVYDENFVPKGCISSILEWAMAFENDWEEVTEKETNQIPNQDQPARSMTKFEMAVFMAMQGFISASSRSMPDTEFMVSYSIEIVKETFKQLNELK